MNNPPNLCYPRSNFDLEKRRRRKKVRVRRILEENFLRSPLNDKEATSSSRNDAVVRPVQFCIATSCEVALNKHSRGTAATPFSNGICRVRVMELTGEILFS